MATDRMAAAAAPRIFAFAKALGLTVDHLVALLESYDLHLLSGPAMREAATSGQPAPVPDGRNGPVAKDAR